MIPHQYVLVICSVGCEQLIHLTLWNYCDWIPLLISGIVFGASAFIMIVMADKGVKKWTL